ncbi:MAG TPA: hypothetical protein PKC08_08535 [Pseudomonadales bacterium]|nr:hypothetical protein [Pseudomonadales bacterium]
MKQLFVIRNQHQHYLGRNHDWVDGSHPPALFRTPHRDMAVNELFEVNVKDFALRGEIIVCETDERGLPVVEVLNPIVESVQDADAGITNAEAAST